MSRFNTFVDVSSSFEAKCKLRHDTGYSLQSYMKLPVDQYVCIQMPLDATLERMDGIMFNLTVPPVTFFNLAVSPMVLCRVSQSSQAVVIESNDVVLRGSPFVVSLNGCYKISIRTEFNWIDTAEKKAILSRSEIHVKVDPPPPFKFFGKRVLETTGNLAMKIALRQIENAFVQALARDYERWAVDKPYRDDRAAGFCDVSEFDSEDTLVATTTTAATASPPLTPVAAVLSSQAVSTKELRAVEKAQPQKIVATTLPVTTSPTSTLPVKPSAATATTLESEVVHSTAKDDLGDVSAPAVLTDDICLVPGDPVVRIEEAPGNSRRIFTGVDISANVDDVWAVLTDYENLQNVIPSLVKNKVMYRNPNGGARLSQVGGAKVLPGVTFTAKTILDVNLYLENNPIPPSMCANYLMDLSSSDQAVREFDKALALKRDVFPRPYAITSLPHRDITMQNVEGEGDFDHYQGIWRMQSLPNCALDGSDACRLTYAVEIRPKGFLPVSLIEGRIASDLRTNLRSIREYVDKRVEARRVNDALAVSVTRAASTTKSSESKPLNADTTFSSSEATIDTTYINALVGSEEVNAGLESILSTIKRVMETEPVVIEEKVLVLDTPKPQIPATPVIAKSVIADVPSLPTTTSTTALVPTPAPTPKTSIAGKAYSFLQYIGITSFWESSSPSSTTSPPSKTQSQAQTQTQIPVESLPIQPNLKATEQVQINASMQAENDRLNERVNALEKDLERLKDLLSQVSKPK